MENEPTREEMYAKAIYVASQYEAEAIAARMEMRKLETLQEKVVYHKEYVASLEVQSRTCARVIVAAFGRPIFEVERDICKAATTRLEGEE